MSQWFQDKAPGGHARVREHKLRVVEGALAKVEEIEVHRPGRIAVAVLGQGPAEGTFDFLAVVKQIERAEIAKLEFNRGVEELRGTRRAVNRSGSKQGCPEKPGLPAEEGKQSVTRGREQLTTVAEIRTHGQSQSHAATMAPASDLRQRLVRSASGACGIVLGPSGNPEAILAVCFWPIVG